jgi:hypothetical protein
VLASGCGRRARSKALLDMSEEVGYFISQLVEICNGLTFCAHNSGALDPQLFPRGRTNMEVLEYHTTTSYA